MPVYIVPFPAEEICANCGRSLRNAKCTSESIVYSPGVGYGLCEPCWDEENEAIDAAGTNNLPKRIAHYKRVLAETA